MVALESLGTVSYSHSIATVAVSYRFDTIHERDRHLAIHRTKATAALCSLARLQSRGKNPSDMRGRAVWKVWKGGPVERQLAHLDGVWRVRELWLVRAVFGQLMRRPSQTLVRYLPLVSVVVQPEVLAYRQRQQQLFTTAFRERKLR